MDPLLASAQRAQPRLIADLRQLVECESPSDDATSVARCAELLTEQVRDIAKPKLIKAQRRGPHLRLEFTLSGRRKQGQVLAVGHTDTVWPLGTLRSMPWREADGRLWGPGVYDMKGGLVFFCHAVRLLIEHDIPVPRKVVLLAVSDEEVGSTESRALTEAEAQRSDHVLVLEPGTGLQGHLKTARKGIGNYRLTVRGVSAHAGVDPAKGASAVLEAAHQIVRLAALNDLEHGITLNAGVIRGGTRSNVIPAECRVEIDLRVPRLRDAERLDKALRKLKPVDKRCTLELSGGLNRPPMERTKAIAALFTKARSLAAELGVDLQESATGGGSDGNFTAALGIPTLDGLGAVGEGAHAVNESVLIGRIPDRVALLAKLISS